jgi:hypothetical protein
MSERDLPGRYDEMLALADLFDAAGAEMRSRSGLGPSILADEDLTATEELSRATFARAEEDIRAATTGKRGLLTRSVELDADALVVRATVLTYQWIDELQQAAYKTLGTIAGRALGYLAPEVALGGAILTAGLIEPDALDRDGVTAYLNELAENHPELMEHFSGRGGLVENLQMRSLLTSGALAADDAGLAAKAGLRALGVDQLGGDAVSAFRDAAGAFVQPPVAPEASAQLDAPAPESLEDVMERLAATDHRINVERVGTGRYVAYLPANFAQEPGRLRLVGAATRTEAQEVVAAIEAVLVDPEPRVMLVGAAAGGTVSAEIAAALHSDAFVIDQVITAGAPSAQVPVIPPHVRILSLEDRSDPIALMGSLINVGVPNRTTVVFDTSGTGDEASPYVAGGRAVDAATHPDLRAELARLRELGYLAG